MKIAVSSECHKPSPHRADQFSYLPKCAASRLKLSEGTRAQRAVLQGKKTEAVLRSSSARRQHPLAIPAGDGGRWWSGESCCRKAVSLTPDLTDPQHSPGLRRGRGDSQMSKEVCMPAKLLYPEFRLCL